jgi:REP element-mobilizing transposase RayT
MTSNQEFHNRRSTRLKGYDYTLPTAYFVTLVTWQRELLFGEIVDGDVRLNDIGEIVRYGWLWTEEIRRPEVSLDEFIIMPNHLHGIIVIHDLIPSPVGATRGSPLQKHEYPPRGPKPKSLGALIAGFKSSVTKRVNKHRNLPGHPIWQRNYFDRIIRDEEELNAVRKYIQSNPSHWEKDEENPANL